MNCGAYLGRTDPKSASGANGYLPIKKSFARLAPRIQLAVLKDRLDAQSFGAGAKILQRDSGVDIFGVEHGFPVL
jgi:hypothetical protein